jgi:lipopolysaccharide transport system ATP-binding protein
LNESVHKMEKEVLVKVDGVSKKFAKDLKRSLLYGLADVSAGILRKSMNAELRKTEFWAVKDLSFEVRRGECLGLIGHNGAGKSTLLKMLNGLIRPDKGTIEMHGRVGALIELGAGFNPILTGRENIYNNGAVLGFTKTEIDSKLDEIIDFSELRDFIDMPVQNYSSGMKVRLGFAIAAQMRPDILLIDEVLAVGDMGFVLKCFNSMDKLLQNTAIILVSHSIPQIARMANKIMLMEKGQNMFYSQDISLAITQYYDRFKLEIEDYKGSSKVELISFIIENNGRIYSKEDNIIIEYGSKLFLHIEVDCAEEVFAPEFYLAFYDKEQRNFAEVMNFTKQISFTSPVKGKLKVMTILDQINFSQGKYSITLAMSETVQGTRESLFRYQSALYFTVHGDTHGWAPIQFQPDWHVVI